MASKFYEPGQKRAAKVRELFSAIAPRYDLINDLQSFGLHRVWKRRLLWLAAIHPGDRILDLCCGTGDVALKFAARPVQVVGLDFSEPMLALARARARNLPFTQTRPVAFINGDALVLPFRDGQFDAVTISYGLRNLADIEAGLSEMRRVTKKEARLLILDFGKPGHAPLRIVYFAYLRYWVPLFGRLLCGNPATYSYILESLRDFPAQKGIATLLEKTGWRRVRVLNLLGGMMSITVAEK